MNRRNFLKTTIITSALLSFNKSIFAQIPNNHPYLLVVMLRGAADGLSMLVPYNDEYYYDARKLVAIPKEKCFQINETFGLNPALEKSIYQFYKNNQAVLIPACGQNNNSRSHFQAQDVMEYGMDLTYYQSGFIGRLQEILKNDKAISFTENITAITKSKDLSINNITSKHLSGQFEFGEDNYKYSEFKDIYSNVEKNIKFINDMKKIDFDRSTKLGQVAQFMKMSNYKIGFVDFGDWDTHSSQGSLNGNMFNLLSNLDKELFSFKENLGDLWNNTLVVVMSEFGRTLKENGNGTDHGHGNLVSLMGGLITKSQIAGDWLTLKKENLHEQRDLPVFYDYRSVLSEVMAKMYDLNKKQIDYIFPNVNPTNFNIV